MIDDLIEISHFAARHPLWVQGGGGNCSVKNNTQMVIKASGFVLEDVCHENGFVELNLATGEPSHETSLRASMESPLHLLLGRYVIHTHPAIVGALLCAEEGSSYFKKIFPENHFVWIDYTTPGKKLFSAVAEKLKAEKIDTQKPIALLLQNHGLFTAAPTKIQAMELHHEVMERCEKNFKTTSVEKSLLKRGQYLSPDHAVYGALDENTLSEKQIKALIELEQYSSFVLAKIFGNHWTPRFLSDTHIAELLGMEEEKYRQQLWGKKE
jgi:rhamnose utilization protein RhaD (predicted bifunctional aldolase and dehydrogenase)